MTTPQENKIPVILAVILVRPVTHDEELFETSAFTEFDGRMTGDLEKLVDRWAPLAAPKAARSEPSFARTIGPRRPR